MTHILVVRLDELAILSGKLFRISNSERLCRCVNTRAHDVQLVLRDFFAVYAWIEDSLEIQIL